MKGYTGKIKTIKTGHVMSFFMQDKESFKKFVNYYRSKNSKKVKIYDVIIEK